MIDSADRDLTGVHLAPGLCRQNLLADRPRGHVACPLCDIHASRSLGEVLASLSLREVVAGISLREIQAAPTRFASVFTIVRTMSSGRSTATTNAIAASECAPRPMAV